MTAEKPKVRARAKKAKDTLVKRQNLIFLTMLLVGVFLLVMSQFTDQRLLSEGIAFIIVGFVGLLMSLTTSDVGQRIIDAVDKADARMSKSVDMLNKSIGVLQKSIDMLMAGQKEISDNQKEISDNQKEISASLKYVISSLDKLNQSQDKLNQSQDMTAKILTTIYESQQNDRMREKD